MLMSMKFLVLKYLVLIETCNTSVSPHSSGNGPSDECPVENRDVHCQSSRGYSFYEKSNHCIVSP